MNKYFVFILTLSFLSMRSWAVGIPSDNQRLDDTARYAILPGFPQNALEFVHEGIEDDELMKQYLRPVTIQFIKNQHLRWLQVRDVRVDKQGIINVTDGVLIPIVMGIRYMKIRNWIDGTVNALFHVTTSQGHIRVEFVDYNDNRIWQIVGRIAWWIDFDKLSNDVAGDTLRTFLNQPDATNQLLSIRP